MRVAFLALLVWLVSFLAQAATPPTTPQVPNDPTWHLALKRLRSNSPHKRWLALRWLQKQTHKAVIPLLIQTTRHPDQHTRTWAIAALANYKAYTQTKIFQKALRDPVEGVRLQAIVALQKRRQWPPIWPLHKDRSAIVREVVCRLLAKHKQYQRHAVFLRTCLRDRIAMVRRGTAETLQPYASQLPYRLKRDMLTVLRLRHRRPYRWRRSRRRYNALWRMRRYHNRIRSYGRSLKYRHRKASAFFNPKQKQCIHKHQLAFIGQQSEFQKEYSAFILARQRGQSQQSRKMLSAALLTYRACLRLYREALNCRRTYPDYRASRAYRRYLQKSILFPNAPAYLIDAQSRYQLRVGLHFVADTTFDILRHDLRPRTIPKGQTVTGPFPEAYPGVSLTGGIHWRLGKHWQLQLHNRFAGHYQLQFTQLSGVNNHFRLNLMHYRRGRRKRSFFFLEESLLYTQNTADTEALPTDYNGPRLVQHARIGAYWRWGRLYRSWPRQEEWTFRLHLQNQLRLPLHAQVAPLDWPLTLHHELLAKLEKQLFFFRLGAKGTLAATHPLAPSAMVPGGHFTGALTIAMGDIYDPTTVALIKGEIGYRVLLPFVDAAQTIPLPTRWEAREAGYPFAKALFQGHLPFMPLQWRLWAEGSIESSVRGPYSHFTYFRIGAEARIGPPSVLSFILSRPWVAVLRIDGGEATFGTTIEQQISNNVTSPTEPSIIRDINITLRSELQLWKGLRLTVSNQLRFLRNSFVPIRVPNAPDQTQIDTVRNIFMVQLEYIWQGEKK